MTNKIKSLRWWFIVFAASISALGTIPYGFEFAQIFKPHSYLLFVFSGIIFALASALANAMLGIYSFLNAQVENSFFENIFIKLLSFLSAVPIGFMCYYGYDNFLSISINLVFALIVTLINSAIAYSAILNLIKEIKLLPSILKFKNEILFRSIGFFVGALVSLIAYMSAIHGVAELLYSLKLFDKEFAFQLACFIGFLTWLPYAALFANATQIFAGKSYFFVVNFFHGKREIAFSDILIFIFSVLSGAAFTQIGITFFGLEMSIPSIFKALPMQHFIYHFLIPFSFVSSVAVNYLALKALFARFQANSHFHSDQ